MPGEINEWTRVKKTYIEVKLRVASRAINGGTYRSNQNQTRLVNTGVIHKSDRWPV